MTKWIFNGTLHPLFERRKIEVEAASQLIKGVPTPSQASLRDCSWPSVNSFEIGVHGWPVGGIDLREKSVVPRFSNPANSFHSVGKQKTKRWRKWKEERPREKIEEGKRERERKENVGPFNRGTRSRAFRGSAFSFPLFGD